MVYPPPPPPPRTPTSLPSPPPVKWRFSAGQHSLAPSVLDMVVWSSDVYSSWQSWSRLILITLCWNSFSLSLFETSPSANDQVFNLGRSLVATDSADIRYGVTPFYGELEPTALTLKRVQFSSIHFSSRWFLCAQKRLNVFHPISHKFLQCSL